ncbi:MAG TPA: lysophospholipid acyltransferase family protein [Candidatus Dormibacteraeota bacterium]|nr:lysophospholipid acyltransferase family protein [Candidatus Dormibacteraeota bacterium]
MIARLRTGRRRTLTVGMLREAGADALTMLRNWRPPEHPPPEEAPRRGRRRRAAEPTWGRSDTAATIRRNLQRSALFPLLEVLGRPEVVGLHHVHGVRPPIIFAPNHASHADAPLVLKALPAHIRERTVVPAAADYFFDRTWLSVFVTLGLNGVPFDRQHDIADSVRRCERFLRHGHSIVLFPEGTRSTTGRLRGFKAGVAHLGVQTGAPVIPVYLQGTHALLARGKALPRPSAIAVHFGTPLVAGRDESARSFNQRLEAAVIDLVTQLQGHAHRDAEPRRGGWREAWTASAPHDARQPARSTSEAASWRESWRSTTPR